MEDQPIQPVFDTKETSFSAKQLSQEEFQSTLFYWFNEKGLVSHIRSYLRMKMIDVLRNYLILFAILPLEMPVSV